jgi:ribosomal protein S18 acetylase RimI-like enzyme
VIYNNIKIERVTKAQLADLTYISRKTFTDAFAHLNNPDDLKVFLSDHLTNDSLDKELGNPESEFYFAVENNAPIAYLKINTGNAQTELKQDSGLEIERIYVLKDHQGKKLGQQLIKQSMQLARQKNKTYIWLGVWELNNNAIRFYQNNGFKIFDKHHFTVGNDIQTDIMMKLQLDI